jgi:hypothetical protein
MPMAGGTGFEPVNARTKTWCLTTWPTPIACNETNHTVFLIARGTKVNSVAPAALFP